MKAFFLTLAPTLALTSAVLTGVSAAPAADTPRTFSGVITDDMCARGGHATMRMGPTDAECTRACVNIHGAAYVLFDGKNVYGLSDQQSPDRFAGRRAGLKTGAYEHAGPKARLLRTPLKRPALRTRGHMPCISPCVRAGRPAMTHQSHGIALLAARQPPVP